MASDGSIGGEAIGDLAIGEAGSVTVTVATTRYPPTFDVSAGGTTTTSGDGSIGGESIGDLAIGEGGTLGSIGGWTPSTGTSLFAMIDEADPGDDADYDQSSVSPTAEVMTVGFAVATPAGAVTSDHRIRYRLKGDGSCPATIVLKCGATTIKTWNQTPPSTFTTYTETLSSGEAATITNYALLTLSIQAN